MKKLLCIVLTFAFVLSCGTTAFAASNTELNSALSGTPLAPEGFTENPLNALMYDSVADDRVTAATSSIYVKVSSPCDEEWRARYSSWMYEANMAIENADEMMLDRFGIDLRSVAQNAWDSTDTSSNQGLSLLDEAWSEWGLRNGAQLMIAFTGQSHGMGGWAYLNTRRCIVFDQGRDANSCVTRHEVGHLYGCPDHYNNPSQTNRVCVMNDSYNMYDSLCSSCNSIWNSNKDSK